MIRVIFIGTCLFTFLFAFNDKDILGVWLQDADISFYIFKNDNTYRVLEFWDDRDGESETYNWKSPDYGLWSIKGNKLCFQHLENWPSRKPYRNGDGECFSCQLDNNYLIINYGSQGPHKHDILVKHRKVN